VKLLIVFQFMVDGSASNLFPLPEEVFDANFHELARLGVGFCSF